MPKGSGGGGGAVGGDGAEMVSVAQLRRLLGIQGDAAQGSGGGGKGAADRRPRERRDRRQQRGAPGGGGGGPEGREGDWSCGACAFAPNFAWKTRCFNCGAARPREQRATAGRAAAGRSGVDRGPIGAGGARPLLSTFSSRAAAAAAGAPTFRPAGVSVAARAMARIPAVPSGAGGAERRQGAGQQPQQQRAQAQAQHACGGAQPPPAAAAASGKGGHLHGASSAPSAAPVAAQRRPRWADDVPPCDRREEDDDDVYMDADALDADAEPEEEEWDDDGQDELEATPEQLRQTWLAECRAVKALESQGRHSASAALAAARDARDEAEAAWRRAMGPTPVSVRMGRAQQRLDKAARALEKSRLDLVAFDEEMDKRRAALQQRIDEAEDRYWARSGQLDELHAEAGELAAGTAAAHAARRAGDGACDDVAADLQALAESLPEESEARCSVNLILAKLASVAGPSGPQRFDIADAGQGGRDGARMAEQPNGGGADGNARWTEDSTGRWNRRAAFALEGKGPCADDGGWQCPKKPVRISGGKASSQGSNFTGAASSGWNAAPLDDGSGHLGGCTGGEQGEAPTTGLLGPSEVSGEPSQAAEAAAGAENDPASRNGARPGQGRKRGGDADACSHQKSHRGEDIVLETSVETGGDDAARAAQLQKEQEIAIWAARNAQAIFGDESSRAIAGQLYAHKVQAVVQRARELGVDPRAEDGRELLELAPEDFTKWVQAVLEPAEKGAAEAREL